jgi:hypothetical protein
MALGAAFPALAATVLALTLCGCVGTPPPDPTVTGSNKPDALLPGAQATTDPGKGKFFTKQGGGSGPSTSAVPAKSSSQSGVNN